MDLKNLHPEIQFAKQKEMNLIKETLKGKSSSFAKIISLCENRVKAVGYSFFKNQHDTEDFMQEVFIKVYEKLSTFKGECRLSTWITKIAYNQAINSKNRRKEYETIADEDSLKFAGDTPEEEHIKKSTQEAIHEAVKELPEKYSVCLDLFFFHDMSHQEIEEVTGIPINTIKSHIFRAKKILSERLEDYKN